MCIDPPAQAEIKAALDKVCSYLPKTVNSTVSYNYVYIYMYFSDCAANIHVQCCSRVLHLNSVFSAYPLWTIILMILLKQSSMVLLPTKSVQLLNCAQPPPNSRLSKSRLPRFVSVVCHLWLCIVYSYNYMLSSTAF